MVPRYSPITAVPDQGRRFQSSAGWRQPVSWPGTYARRALLTVVADQVDNLARWLYGEITSRNRGVRALPAPLGGLRFAFYGRVSTRDNQDEQSSRQWQYENAERVIAEAGVIVRSFFDAGVSRSLPWTARPQAHALLGAVADPDRGFDAIIVGEYERGFSGEQLGELMPYLQFHGVALWLPELSGPVDPADPSHRALIMMLGHQSQREVLRARFRTRTAMKIQVREHGRHIGGRPPYGYRIIDVGPHPNPRHARWGRQLQQLDPDPGTARHVRWMFARRLAGDSVAVITARLNEKGIPCPSEHDRSHNSHRNIRRWSQRTVATILENPRYTGRQIWNRYSTDHQETRPGDRATTTRPIRRPNTKDQWVLSTGRAHPALISEADFVAVQKVSAVSGPRDGGPRAYLLTGLVICGVCGRRAESQWAYNRPAYRCRHGRRGARRLDDDRPFHAREDRLLTAIAVQLDLRTGEGQILWPDADIAAYLRTHGFAVRGTNDTVVIDGIPPTNSMESVEVAATGSGADQGSDDHPPPIAGRYRKAAPRNHGKRRLIRVTIPRGEQP
jgi:site-specific DNA recombinase